MDIRERLLHNEIQNLGQMLQIVSYELTVLSDFMKEKFGASYEKFRASHSQQSRGSLMMSSQLNPGGPKRNSKRSSPVTARKSTSGQSKRAEATVTDDDENDGTSERKRRREDEDDDSNNMVLSDDDGGAGQDANYELPYSDAEDEDDSIPANVAVPEGARIVKLINKRDPDEKAIGRQRSNIWSKYVVSKLPNGKLHAVCPRCGKQVSSKVERLTGHYRKCVEGVIDAEPTGRGYSTSQLEEEDKIKVAEYIKELKTGEGSAAGDGNTQQKSSEKDPLGRKGRALDPVWEFFRSVEDLETGKKIVKCKKCNLVVSSKVERVRRHFVICNELDKEGEGNNG